MFKSFSIGVQGKIAVLLLLVVASLCWLTHSVLRPQLLVAVEEQLSKGFAVKLDELEKLALTEGGALSERWFVQAQQLVAPDNIFLVGRKADSQLHVLNGDSERLLSANEVLVTYLDSAVDTYSWIEHGPQGALFGAIALPPDPESGRRYLILQRNIADWEAIFYGVVQRYFLGLFVVLLLFFGALAVLFWRKVRVRLQHMVQVSEAVAQGDLTARTSMPTDDEIGQVAAAMNTMMQRIQASQEALLNNNRQLDDILHHIPSWVFIKDLQGQYILTNRRFDEAFSERGPLVGRTVYDVVEPNDADRFVEYDQEVMASKQAISRRVSIVREGEEHQLLLVKFPLLDVNDAVYGICSVVTDLSNVEQTENLLNISRSIFENTREAILITDVDRKILDVNQSFERITGYTKSDVVGLDPNFRASGKTQDGVYRGMWQALEAYGHWTGEVINRRKDGQEYHERLSINSIMGRDEVVTGYIGIFQDITEEKQVSENLTKLAYRDPLTDLHNRESFKIRLADTVSYAKRYRSSFGVLFIDLDHFKEVNDTQGHDFGDQLLVMVAERLRGNTRTVDVVSRLGGDEFTVLVPGEVTESGLAVLANQIITVLSAPFVIEKQKVMIGSSIGIAIFPRDGDDIELLLKHADAAMYNAKAQGRGCFSFFDFNINARNQRMIKVKHALRSAIEDKEFSLVYQPKVNPAQMTLTGYEALIRWDSAQLGPISPAEFIPIAEESGEIERITDWVLQRVATDMQVSNVLDRSNVSINISAKQFRSDAWINTLRELDANNLINAHAITIEVTETALVDSFDKTLEQLQALRDLGATIAIDDFGTGYSSLSYLKKMPIQYLKIDRSFVKDIGVDPDDQTIVQTVIVMSHALGIKVIAEGAESQEQVDFLSAQQCDEIQGYYFAKPMPLQDLAKFSLQEPAEA
ncbi:EAL domain-containing protein [Neptunomonas sp. XY-337]|uniref:bifunctional diguanylate cyclase/phosphodiesterase n=1 Tax=Neptunomonas sp. XY-337 TaxID=2561897 RepID=UPI0010AAF3BE|nr:EAL domain-containing protein [Neptunomonas sp. XY-337]